jgi:hypothetical protein
MRNNGIFTNTEEISREPRQTPNWLDRFADSLYAQETMVKQASKTAVEVVRERAYQPSVYEMMSAIVSAKKPKYSSVEEAVLDYQKRTGLEDYIKLTAASKLKSIASEIVTASEDEDDADDKKKSNDNVIGEGRIIEFEIVDDSNEVRWDESRQSLVAESIKPTASIEFEITAEVELPEIIKKYPTIDNFIKNIIDTNHGIQVPALLHSIVETFGRDGISQQIFSDRELMNYINDLLLSKQHLSREISTNIGRGVGTQVEYSGNTDSNKDPFISLTPNKSM